MLLDILGVIIGFVAIVLVLSILVTSIVQTISSLFRLRNHALRVALGESQLQSTLAPFAAPTDPSVVALIRVAAEAAERPTRDRRVTWLEASEIVDPLAAAGVDARGLEIVRQRLERTRRVMEDKYLQWARGLTLAASLIVAFVFGASAPELLQRLQTDQAFRAQAEALGDSLSRELPSEYTTIVHRPALRARVQFLEKYPQYTQALGAIPLEAHSVDFVVAAVETALDAEETRDELAEEYRTLLEQALVEESEGARAALERSVADLGALEIAPVDWGGYYLRTNAMGHRSLRLDRLIGVLFMAVLLSFGAPFWYQALKELIGLKDALRKKNESDARETETVAIKVTERPPPPGARRGESAAGPLRATASTDG